MVPKTVFPLLLLLTHICFSQNIDDYLKLKESTSLQKLYLHTDRDFYFIGDTLWFAANLLDGQTNIPQKELCNFYVDLINAKGETVRNELFILYDGFCSGYLPFSDTLITEGCYLLRATTNLFNDPDNSSTFTKVIQLSTIKSRYEESTKDPEKYTPKNIDVSFLPEGGFLLAGVSNCVAFKAVDQFGKGITISGKLLNENNDTILNFKSIYKGSGKFYFSPESGEKYFAVINGFPKLKFPLPEIRKKRSKIMIINQSRERLQLTVQSKNVRQDQPCYLVGMHRNNGLFYMKLTSEKLNTVFRIDCSQFRGGINRLVILDEMMQPLSERLIFYPDSEICRVNIDLQDTLFSNREEVEVHLEMDELPDEFVSVSMAVVDENYMNIGGESSNISSYLLLESELAGHIESPADYFISDDNLDSQLKLDLLMLINGWSNYVWNNLDKSKPSGIRDSSWGFTFSGNVKRFMGKKALPEGSVSLIVKSDHNTRFVDIPLNETGSFEFNNIVFYDSAFVFAQARNKRNSNNVQLEMNFHPMVPPEPDLAKTELLNNYLKVPFSVHKQKSYNESHLKEFYPDKNNILIEEVKVTAKYSEPQINTSGFVLKNQGSYLLTPEMTAGTINILEFLKYKVPLMEITKDSFGNLQTSYGIFIDGYRYLNLDEAKAWNISDFKTIEIITPPGSNIYGARAIHGAIILTLKSGEESNTSNIPLLGGLVERVKGFSALREFYSPIYTAENINSEVPDYRSTLYWNPRISIQNGEKEISFFSCDNIADYKIVVEGISETGKICIGEGYFRVED